MTSSSLLQFFFSIHIYIFEVVAIYKFLTNIFIINNYNGFIGFHLRNLKNKIKDYIYIEYDLTKHRFL
jgi:hypothetical protein